MVDGSIIVTGDGAGNTTLGYFGASDGDTDRRPPCPRAAAAASTSATTPTAPLPDGINLAVDVRRACRHLPGGHAMSCAPYRRGPAVAEIAPPAPSRGASRRPGPRSSCSSRSRSRPHGCWSPSPTASTASFQAYSHQPGAVDLMQRPRLAMHRIITADPHDREHLPVDPAPVRRLRGRPGRRPTTASTMFDAQRPRVRLRARSAAKHAHRHRRGRQVRMLLMRGVEEVRGQVRAHAEPARPCRTGGRYDRLLRATILLTVRTDGNALDVDERVGRPDGHPDVVGGAAAKCLVMTGTRRRQRPMKDPGFPRSSFVLRRLRPAFAAATIPAR